MLDQSMMGGFLKLLFSCGVKCEISNSSNKIDGASNPTFHRNECASGHFNSVCPGQILARPNDTFNIVMQVLTLPRWNNNWFNLEIEIIQSQLTLFIENFHVS